MPTEPINQIVAAGPLGGAANEAGHLHRAGVAAFFVAHGLTGQPVVGLDLPREQSIPHAVGAESDAPVDDLEVSMTGGGTLFVQAKLTMSFGDSPRGAFATEVLAQWIELVRAGALGGTDRLVLAVGHAPESLRALGDGLSRRRAQRAGGAYSNSAREANALRTLENLASEKSIDLELLLDLAVVLELHVVNEGRESALATEQMLDGVVVPIGRGAETFCLMRDITAHLARDRCRLHIAGWRDELMRLGIAFLDHPASLTKADRLRQVQQRYNDRLSLFGSQIELGPLGIEMAPIAVDNPGLDLVVRPIDDDQDDRDATEHLAYVLRRRGRLLLVGLPGSGKSTALRQLAALAVDDPYWPTPMLIRLDSIRKLLRDGDVVDALICGATSTSPEADRDLLSQWIRRRLGEGRVLLLLDGLDECRGDAGMVVEALRGALVEMHPDVEVVLSTRASTFAMGRSLGLPAFDLRIPRDFATTLDRFADAMAWEQDIREGEGQAWVEKRVAWERDVTSKDKALRETPLTRLLLLYLTRHRDVADLPKRRAEVLSLVVDEAADRWEVVARRASSVHVGALDSGAARVALLQGFDVIAHQLFAQGAAERGEVHHALMGMSMSDFGSPSGSAAAAADDIIAFWDESSIFVLSDDGTEILPRTRLFAEIGEARYLHRLDVNLLNSAMVDHLARFGDRSEIIVLAACLDRRAAHALVNGAVESGDREKLLLAVRAFEEGAGLEDSDIDSLARGLRRHLEGESFPAWQAWKAITRLPLVGSAAEEAMEDLIRLPASHLLVGRALGTLAWFNEDDMEPLFEELLTVGPPTPLEDPADSNPLLALAVDRGYSVALLGTASRVLPQKPDLAPLFAEKASESLAAVDQREVDRILNESGHDHLVEMRRNTEMRAGSSVLQMLEVGRKGDDRFLDIVSHLGTHKELAWREARRLDGFVGLITALDIAHSPAGWLPMASLRHPDDVRSLLQVAIALGSFDVEVIASEACLVIERLDLDSSIGFTEPPEAVALDGWASVEAADDVRRSLIQLMQIHPWFRHVAVKALWDCPERTKCVRELEPLLGHANPQVRTAAAKLTAIHVYRELAALEALATSEDPHVRSQAGRVAATVARGSPQYAAIVNALLVDEDLGVRRHVKKGLGEGDHPQLAEAFLRSQQQPALGWRCPHCDFHNDVEAGSCQSCNIVGPTPQ